MLTVHATLQPNGQVQLPPALARDKPVPVLMTILEPLPEVADPTAASAPKGNIAATLALLHSPEFQALPRSDPEEVERRIQELRNDWNDE